MEAMHASTIEAGPSSVIEETASLVLDPDSSLENPGVETEPAPAVAQKCRIPTNPFSGKCTTTIRELWTEYTVGIHGQPSIRQLEHDHGASWRFWDRKPVELVLDSKKNILRLPTDPVGRTKEPLKDRNKWKDAWYKYQLVIRRLKLYSEVLMGPDFQMSGADADETACQILEKEMATSGIKGLKAFSETHLRAGGTTALKTDKELPETLKKLMNELDIP
jgi:hypothetical protein